VFLPCSDSEVLNGSYVYVCAMLVRVAKFPRLSTYMSVPSLHVSQGTGRPEYEYIHTHSFISHLNLGLPKVCHVDVTRLRFCSYLYSSLQLHMCSTHLNVRDGNTWWGEGVSLQMRPLNGRIRIPKTTNVYTNRWWNDNSRKSTKVIDTTWPVPIRAPRWPNGQRWNRNKAYATISYILKLLR